MTSMTNHPSFSTPFGGRGDLASLRQLRDDLGIQATTILRSSDGGFGIDWNGEAEDFATFEEAAQALRLAAQ